MTISPTSLSSPLGFQHAADGFISDGSPEPRTSEKFQPSPAASASAYPEERERVQSAPQRDPSQQLFLDNTEEQLFLDAEDNNEDSMTMVLVNEVAYPAGGAYALVKSLKLSPRPIL